MTTIAYDGTTLAADRRVSLSGARFGRMCKVARIDVPGFGVCRVGAAGEYESVETAALVPRRNLTVLAIDRRGRAWLRLGLEDWIRATHRFASIGSGSDFALGAMMAGVAARRAVMIASKIDLATGDGVDTLA